MSLPSPRTWFWNVMLSALSSEKRRAFCDGDGLARVWSSPPLPPPPVEDDDDDDEDEPLLPLSSLSRPLPLPFPFPLPALALEGEVEGFLPFPLP